MEVTLELVLDRVRAVGGRLELKGLNEESLVAWRHAAKVLQLQPRRPDRPVVDLTQERIKRRPVLGGLINEYERAA